MSWTKVNSPLIGKTLGILFAAEGVPYVTVYPRHIQEKAAAVNKYLGRGEPSKEDLFRVALYTFVHEWEHYNQYLDKRITDENLNTEKRYGGLLEEEINAIERDADSRAASFCQRLEIDKEFIEAMNVNVNSGGQQ
jgi:hypothetical protein